MVALNVKNVKMTVQMMAFAFFVLQMVFAVQKYLAKPSMTSPGNDFIHLLKKNILAREIIQSPL